MNNLNALFDQFCLERQFVKNLSPCTIAFNQNYHRLFVRFLENQKKAFSELEEIRVEDVLKFLVHGKRTRNWKTSTQYAAWKSIKVFWNWLWRNEYIASNIMDRVPAPRQGHPLPKPLNKSDALALLDLTYKQANSEFLKRRNRLMFAMMLFAGLRLSETIDLQINHLDLNERVIHVHHGKGAKDRLVPISARLEFLIQDYLAIRVAMKPSRLLFFSENSQRKLTPSAVKWLAAKISKLTQIKFSCHRFRHTFATLLVEGGVELFSLSRLMGHANIRTTIRYLATSTQTLKRELDKHPLI